MTKIKRETMFPKIIAGIIQIRYINSNQRGQRFLGKLCQSLQMSLKRFIVLIGLIKRKFFLPIFGVGKRRLSFFVQYKITKNKVVDISSHKTDVGFIESTDNWFTPDIE